MQPLHLMKCGGENSVPDKFVIQDYKVYDEGIGHKVEYHHPNGKITSSHVMLDGLKSLLKAGVLKSDAHIDEE